MGCAAHVATTTYCAFAEATAAALRRPRPAAHLLALHRHRHRASLIRCWGGTGTHSQFEIEQWHLATPSDRGWTQLKDAAAIHIAAALAATPDCLVGEFGSTEPLLATC